MAQAPKKRGAVITKPGGAGKVPEDRNQRTEDRKIEEGKK
jgi:hypothetical protein